jgi:exodeoxyribonuclease VII large subunit
VIVLTRGGGSMEDLQAFNSEEVAAAVFGSRLPVVVGVGHERDESLADYVADIRASTPSNAAEIVVPDRREVLAFIDGGVRGLDSAMSAAIARRARAAESLAARIETHARRAITGFERTFQDLARHFAVFEERLTARSRSLEADMRLLKSLDPRRPLERGYAMVRSGGRLLRDSAAIGIGDAVEIQLAHGALDARVEKKR